MDEYVIFAPEGGLGKIVASTFVVKKIKEKFPDRKIIVLSPWPEVFLNNPNVYRSYRAGNSPYFYNDFIKDRDTIILKGDPYYTAAHLYNKQHIVKTWCELHDLPLNQDEQIVPELFYTPVEVETYKQLFKRSKPIITLQTNGGPYDLNKNYCWTRDFPYEQAQILVNELHSKYHIIHVTRPNCQRLSNVEMLENIPNKRSFLALLMFSHRQVLIDSSLQHAAAAFNKPSYVAWIGTSPVVFGYEMHINAVPNIPKKDNEQVIDGVFFDHDFNGPEHEFPYESTALFKLQDIYDYIVK